MAWPLDSRVEGGDVARRADDDRRPWVPRGEVIARAPDNEPLIARFEPLAVISDDAVDEAKRRYAGRFDVADDST
jgi:hypothetical protein